MKKQQIILVVVVAIIFAGLIVIGLTQSGSNVNKPAGGAEQSAENQPAAVPQGEFNSAATSAGSQPVISGTSSAAGTIVNTGPTAIDPANPIQSSPVAVSEIPKGAVKIIVTESGFAPASFEANKGAETTLAVSSGDQWTHIFKFKSDKLAKVAIGIGPKETRAITFLAPKEKGEYEFYCDVPGHEQRGEKGKMIVK